MALVTPIVNNIPAFDATESTTITFIANGGDQIVKNEIQIINNATSAVVYSNTVSTYALGQIVPANTLTNGTYYKVAFRTYDTWNNTSEWSDFQPFYCYSAPTLDFNVSDGQTVYIRDFELILTYNQSQNERLESAIIYCYDANNNFISSSGNLFNSNYPPVSFKYTLKNLENNKIYRVKADATTIDGTFITTGIVSFHTNYETIENEGELYLTMDSCNGYINIRSVPVISAVEGEHSHNPSTLSYISNRMVDLDSVVGEIDEENEYSSWIKWYDITPISDAFLFRLWFYPARVSFKVVELTSTDESNHITVTFNRGATQDYLSIHTDDGTRIDKELGTICNGNTKVFLWLRVIGNTWDVRTEILENPDTILEWNNQNNNAIYNTTTDINYGNESYGDFVPRRNVYRALSGSFDNVIIGNGIFDVLDLSININRPYSFEVPQHDVSAVLFVRFDGSIDNNAPTGYTKAILQRKDNSMITWFGLSEIDIPSDVPTEIDYNDYLIPNGIQQTYGLIMYKGETPTDTYTINIIPKWGRTFVSDADESYKLNYSVIYSNGSQNIQNGVLMPIAATYPIVIQNAEGNYRSGSLQFKVLGYQYEIDKTLDRNSIVKQTDDILAFLTNGKPKCIKDWNGNIFICKVINSPQISYDANWGNGITTISFDWVEQSKYNDYDEMAELGIIDNTIPITPTPTPPTPTPVAVEPFIEKVYLPNGNDPDTIYPTQGIYEYDMYFGEIETSMTTASVYMPSVDYNIISYKVNNVSQIIPQKQELNDEIYYILNFREDVSVENSSVEIIVQDNNNHEIGYTFNFILTEQGGYITTSKYYVKSPSSSLIFTNSNEKEELDFYQKYNGEAYRTALYATSDTSNFLGYLFVSDDIMSIKLMLKYTNLTTGNSSIIDLDNTGTEKYYTCQFMNKTWYITGGDLYGGSNIPATTITPSDLTFSPRVEIHDYDWSYYGLDFLRYIYGYPQSQYMTSSVYYTDTTSDIIIKSQQFGYNFRWVKRNNGEAYKFVLNYFRQDIGWVAEPIFISDSPDAVDFIYERYTYDTLTNPVESVNHSYKTTVYDHDRDITWYINYTGALTVYSNYLTIYPYSSGDLLFVPDNVYPSQSYDVEADMVLNFLDHVYHSTSVVSTPVGKYVTPINDYQKWLRCANIYGKNYTSITEITNDALVNCALFSSHNASDYLARCTNSTWINGIAHTSYSMRRLGNVNYCSNLLLSYSQWRNAICNSLYYDYVLNFKNPIMISNTEPSGECYCYPDNSNDAWKVFTDNSYALVYIKNPSQIDGENYIYYKFTEPINILRVKIVLIGMMIPSLEARTTTIKLEGSLDGINWDELYIDDNYQQGVSPYTIIVPYDDKYLYYRIWYNQATHRNKDNNDVSTPQGLIELYSRKDIQDG